MTDIRVTQTGAEIAYTADDPRIKVTQVGSEIVYTVDDVVIRVTQVGAELAFTTDDTNIKVTQLGVEIAYCLIPDAVTDFEAGIDGDDIDLTWTENSYADIRIEHSTNGVDYSPLIEMYAGTATYTHVAPERSDAHYYRLQTFDGACVSSYVLANIVFGGIHTYLVTFEAGIPDDTIHSHGVSFGIPESDHVYATNVGME